MYKLITSAEGYRANAYKDPVGIWTIGYGTTRYPDGKLVKKGDHVSALRAYQLLEQHIEGKILPVLSKIPNWSNLNTNQQQAVISFAYNLGANFYGTDGFGGITRLLKSPDLWDNPKEVHRVFGLYVKGGGKVLGGLVTRRRDEADLFLLKEGIKHE
jgi:GH24 family phage-related lysozyme (muramidase)